MVKDSNKEVFFELLRAGLWEKEVRLSQYKDIDYSAILKLAEEQSVVGLITAGLEHVVDVKVPQTDLLQFIGNTMQIEQRNKSMNVFVARLIEKLRKDDIFTLLVKGQGIAQCYERPLWRACGDVDLLFSEGNYEKAQKILLPLALETEDEDKSLKHHGMTMEGGFVVELHGTLHSHISKHINKCIDRVQDCIFFDGKVRSWLNGNTQIFLPAPDNDVIIVFTHIIQHFFDGGIGLRQICDWCRLLWTYRDSLNHRLLESRLCEMGLMSKWKAFAALVVGTLSMQVEAMPLYSVGNKWEKKAERILSLVLESGNFGHGRDMGYKKRYPRVFEYAISFWVYTRYCIRLFMIFPINAVNGWGRIMRLGVKAKMK